MVSVEGFRLSDHRTRVVSLRKLDPNGLSLEEGGVMMRLRRYLWLALSFGLVAWLTLPLIATARKRHHSNNEVTPSNATQQGLKPACTNPNFPKPAPTGNLGINPQCGPEGTAVKKARPKHMKNN